MPSFLLVGHNFMQTVQTQIRYSAVSDQCLHCLLVGCSIKVGINEQYHPTTLKTEMDGSNIIGSDLEIPFG